jgi:hypothetical protein
MCNPIDTRTTVEQNTSPSHWALMVYKAVNNHFPGRQTGYERPNLQATPSHDIPLEQGLLRMWFIIQRYLSSKNYKLVSWLP